ncbi:MAG TPA: cytochrome c [Candidatus Angelobacter sp.]|nr:cytochrome c [Candidatus Angelobacter sp.]
MIGLKQVLRAMACLLLGTTFLLAAVGDGAWKSKVPEKERARENPYDGQSNAIAVGAKLFRQNCASCHGGEATGSDKKPTLHSDRVRNATPGELEWLLKNGSMKNGMPSWSRLPEQQRWQIVSYLKSLQ